MLETINFIKNKSFQIFSFQIKVELTFGDLKFYAEHMM